MVLVSKVKFSNCDFFSDLRLSVWIIFSVMPVFDVHRKPEKASFVRGRQYVNFDSLRYNIKILSKSFVNCDSYCDCYCVSYCDN